jgi:hypothetical protein
MAIEAEGRPIAVSSKSPPSDIWLDGWCEVAQWFVAEEWRQWGRDGRGHINGYYIFQEKVKNG